MTSSMTSPGHKVGQILKSIYLRQYLSYSVDQKLKMSEMLMAIFLVYSTSGITSGKKVCLELKMAAILKNLKYWTQLQFDLRYEKIVPNYTQKSIFMMMTSSMTSQGGLKVSPLYSFILGSMMSHQRVIVGLSQSAPAVGWGSPLHAWLASVNWIGGARCLNRRYRYGARGMHYHILLRQYSQNCYTYNSVVKNAYSPCHKDACIKISIGNTEWLLRYKGVS